MTVFYDVELHYSQEDTRAWQSPMATVTLIIPLEATTMNNPSNIRSDSGVTAGATVEWQQVRQWSVSRSVGRVRWIHRLSYDRSMLEYNVIKFPPWLFSMVQNSIIGRKTHVPDGHRWKPLPWFCLVRRERWTIQATVGATVGATAGATAEQQQRQQRSDSRSDSNISGATNEQQRTDNRATSERQQSNSRATAERQQSDSSSDIRATAVVTSEQQQEQ